MNCGWVLVSFKGSLRLSYICKYEILCRKRSIMYDTKRDKFSCVYSQIWFTWHLIEDLVLLPMDKMNMTKASLTVWKWLVAFFFFVLKGKSCRRCLVEHLVHSDPLSEMFFFLPMNTRQCYCHDAFCSCCIDEAYMWSDLRMWHKKVLICS